MIMQRWAPTIEEFRKVSLQPDFITVRIQSELTARELINSKCDGFNKNDLERLLDLCNTEKVPPNIYTNQLSEKETCTRFRLSFIGANRKNMINCLESCNRWISALWKTTNDIDTLRMFWKEGSIKGAGIGFPTMILYLKNPDKYNVWIPFLSNGLGVLAGKNLGIKKDVMKYIEFNDTIITLLRQDSMKPPIKPQEVDYILFRIGLNHHAA